VLPLIERELGWLTRLTVAGYVGPGVQMERFRDHPRITLRGPVADVRPLYDSHRLFAAPTRFAAGLPYKVHEAASMGLPVITTDLLCRQLGWQAGEEIIAIDPSAPDQMAAELTTLYRDEARWERIREAALARYALDTNPTKFAQAVATVLGLPDQDV
jgi:O-antigen biosynthesis protein